MAIFHRISLQFYSSCKVFRCIAPVWNGSKRFSKHRWKRSHPFFQLFFTNEIHNKIPNLQNEFPPKRASSTLTMFCPNNLRFNIIATIFLVTFFHNIPNFQRYLTLKFFRTKKLHSKGIVVFAVFFYIIGIFFNLLSENISFEK